MSLLAEPSHVRVHALLTDLAAAARVASVKRLHGTNRFHIPITPDLDLSVRGEITPRDRAIPERAAILFAPF